MRTAQYDAQHEAEEADEAAFWQAYDAGQGKRSAQWYTLLALTVLMCLLFAAVEVQAQLYPLTPTPTATSQATATK